MEPQKHPVDIQYCTQVQGIVLNRGGLNRQSLACFVAKNGQGGLRLLQCDLIKTIHEHEGDGNVLVQFRLSQKHNSTARLSTLERINGVPERLDK